MKIGLETETTSVDSGLQL